MYKQSKEPRNRNDNVCKENAYFRTHVNVTIYMMFIELIFGRDVLLKPNIGVLILTFDFFKEGICNGPGVDTYYSYCSMSVGRKQQALLRVIPFECTWGGGGGVERPQFQTPPPPPQ